MQWLQHNLENKRTETIALWALCAENEHIISTDFLSNVQCYRHVSITYFPQAPKNTFADIQLTYPKITYVSPHVQGTQG